MLRPIRLFLVMLFVSSTARAEGTANLLRDGVFGIAWGSTVEQIEAKFPKGKWIKYPKDLRFYTVRDNRAVFGVDRATNSEFAFGLSSDGYLTSVSITFPADEQTYGALSLKAGERLGSVDPVRSGDPSNQYFPSLIFTNSWPMEEGISVKLIHSVAGFTRTTVLTFTKPRIIGVDVKTGLE